MQSDVAYTSIRDILLSNAQANPQAVTLQQADFTLTHRQLFEQVMLSYDYLRSYLPISSSPVALLCDNTPLTVVTFLALNVLGRTIILLEPKTSASLLEGVHHDTNYDTLIGHFDGDDPALSAAMAGRVMLIEAAGFQQHLTREKGPSTASSRVDESSVENLIYQYTSGSTGRSKAALIPSSNLVTGGRIYQHTFGITSKDRIMLGVPLLHSFGMVAGLMTALVTEARLVIPSQQSPHAVARALLDTEPTIMLGSPLLYEVISRIGVTQLRRQSRRGCSADGPGTAGWPRG